MFSGLVTTIASMPVDIAKTRLQSMKYVDGKNILITLSVIDIEFRITPWLWFYVFRLERRYCQETLYELYRQNRDISLHS